MAQAQAVLWTSLQYSPQKKETAIMNAHAYYQELEEENSPISQPATLPTTEADKLRTWFNTLDLVTMPVNNTVENDFFKHTVSVFRGERVFYLFTKSPQQKIYRRSLPTAQARGDMEALRDGVERFIKQMEAKQEKHNARKAEKKSARDNFVNPYTVGDFLYSSWGYEQTNREFYQVLEVRPLAIKVREVSQTRERTSYDSGTCAPVRDSFLAKEPERWITIQVDASGYHSVPSPIHGNLYAYDGKPVYFSDGY